MQGKNRKLLGYLPAKKRGREDWKILNIKSHYHIYCWSVCQFARQCWAIVNVEVDLDVDPFQILQSFKAQLGVPFFMEVIILLSWTIWKSRNDLIFRQIQPSLTLAKENFREEFRLLLLRAKHAYSPFIE
jgi:hypothetical protein